MSGVVLVGLLWAATGLVLGFRWWTERAQWRATTPLDLGPEDGRPRFGRAPDASRQRALAMLFAYAAGTTTVAVGLFTSAQGLLGLGILLVNAGTVLRFLVLALDSRHLEAPVLPPRRNEAEPIVAGVLLGDLAK